MLKRLSNPKQFVRLLLAGSLLIFACSGLEKGMGDESKMKDGSQFKKSEKQWREILEPDRFAILFKEKTESAFSSDLNEEKRSGTFLCAACYQPLFKSDTKYNSGTGWPSFNDPIPESIDTSLDFKLIYPRTEYHCSRCGGHQGHVFDDGPHPTGKRYCNNGLALIFVPEGEPLPDLRK